MNVLVAGLVLLTFLVCGLDGSILNALRDRLVEKVKEDAEKQARDRYLLATCGTCSDSMPLCKQFKSFGCPDSMKRMCRYSCGDCILCPKPKPTQKPVVKPKPTPKPACSQNCRDTHEGCPTWKKNRYCNPSEGYPKVREVCPLSCGTCTKCRATTVKPKTTAATQAATQPATTPSPVCDVDCKDEAGQAPCTEWNSKGYCAADSKWPAVWDACRLTCKKCFLCSTAETETPTVATQQQIVSEKPEAPATTLPCESYKDMDTNCDSWAEYCAPGGQFPAVRNLCQKTCNPCSSPTSNVVQPTENIPTQPPSGTLPPSGYLPAGSAVPCQGNCFDTHARCQDWARYGRCSEFNWNGPVAQNCPLSCNKCKPCGYSQANNPLYRPQY